MRLLGTLAALALAASALAADKKVEDAFAKADSQLAKGQADEAEKTMAKLVQQLPTAEAHTARARIQLKAGNVEGAAASAAEAVKLSAAATPEVKADALATLAALDLERGSGKDALAHAQEAMAASPTAASLAVLARAQARAGDPAAVGTGQKAVAAGAQNAAAHEALGHALLSVQRGDEAAAAFRQALTLEPRRASARAGLAGALVATGKAAEAVVEAKKATEDNDKSGEAFLAYANALYAAAPNKQQGWGQAINEASQAVFVSPRNAVVVTGVARLFELGGNYDQALTHYRRALESDPGHMPAQMGLLEIESRKDPAAALPRVRELAKQQPQNAALQYMLGKLLARKGDWQDAIGPLANAAQGMPNSAEVHAFLGTVYQYTGQSAEALPPYKRAVELAPTNLEYRSTYGLLLGLNDQCAEAEAELIKVTSSADYKGAGGWVNLGWVYRNCGTKPKAAEAATAYERALKLDPRSAPAAVGLGWALLLAGRYDESIPAFNKSMELEKANAIQAHNGIAWNHYFKKEMAQAKVALERARTAGHADRNLEDAIKNFETRGEQDVERDKEKIKQPDRNASDLDSLGGKLVSGGAGAAASAGQLVKFGKPAVQYLVWAAVNAPDIGVRRASVRALGQIGAAAQSTCPQLKAIAVLPPVGGLIQTNQEMEYNLALGDLRRDAKEASAKIGCR